MNKPSLLLRDREKFLFCRPELICYLHEVREEMKGNDIVLDVTNKRTYSTDCNRQKVNA